MKYFKLAKRRGFTIVELIVVVGIIALLTSVVLFSVNETRKQARDKTRMTDMKQMQFALDLYKEAHGQYPDNCNDAWGWHGRGENHTGASWYTQCDPADGDHITGLAPTFIPKLPLDPKNDDSTYCGYNYLVSNDNDSYKLYLMCSVESLSVESTANEFARCPQSCVDSGVRTESFCTPTTGYALHGGPDSTCW